MTLTISTVLLCVAALIVVGAVAELFANARANTVYPGLYGPATLIGTFIVELVVAGAAAWLGMIFMDLT